MICHRENSFRISSSSSHSLSNVSTFESTGGIFIGILTYQSLPALLYFRKITTLWTLGVEHCQPSTAILRELCIFSYCFSSSSSVQVSGRTCHMSVHTSDPCCTMLDGGSLAFHYTQHIRIHSSLVPNGKRSHQRYSGRLGFKDLPALH